MLVRLDSPTDDRFIWPKNFNFLSLIAADIREAAITFTNRYANQKRASILKRTSNLKR